MRIALIALSAAAVLAACGQASAPPPAGAPPVRVVFPAFQAAYRAEAVITRADGATLPVVLVRDGGKSRLELTTPAGVVVQIAPGEADDARYIVSRVAGRAVAVRQAEAGQLPDAPDLWWERETPAQMTAAGPCANLEQAGVVWQRQGEGGLQQVCLTSDGVALWAANSGLTVWETTSLQRGAQDPSQFAAPRLDAPPPVADAAYDPGQSGGPAGAPLAAQD